MSQPTKKQITQAEARRRVDQAKTILEHRVQASLSDAASVLSRVTFCPEYDEIMKMYDRVKALWYKIDARSQSSKIDLDSEAAETFLAKLSKESKS
jgi:hypothetical protein